MSVGLVSTLNGAPLASGPHSMR